VVQGYSENIAVFRMFAALGVLALTTAPPTETRCAAPQGAFGPEALGDGRASPHPQSELLAYSDVAP
jgi:hypothetical protein